MDPKERARCEGAVGLVADFVVNLLISPVSCFGVYSPMTYGICVTASNSPSVLIVTDLPSTG
eukprot:2980511-Amphidinium_carterae.1